MWGWILGGAAALFLLTRKPAPVQQSTFVGVDFEPGATRPVTMRVGDALTVNLPPGHTYHVDDFSGGGIVVGFVQNPASASTGYNSFTITGMAQGNVKIIVDTRGDTQPMTLMIGVA